MANQEEDGLSKAIEASRQSMNNFDYTVDLDDKRIKQYKGYASIAYDLKAVGEFVSYLLEIKNNGLKLASDTDGLIRLTERSLFVSSIITYARCFTGTDGRGIRLASKDCFNATQTEFNSLHETLMDIRDQYLAHAGISNSEKLFASANFTIQGQDVIMQLSHEIIGQYGLSNKELLTFLDLVKYLLERTVNKRDELSKKYIENLTLEEKQGLLKKAYDEKSARK